MREQAPPLSFKNVSRRFGPVLALDSMNLELLPGEICGLVGENGAGKTTALSLAVGLLRPDSGEVRLFGSDPESQPGEAKKPMAYIPDRPHAPARLSGREYLRYVAALWGVDPEKADQEAVSLIQKFDLQSRYDQRLETYSHGMRQKLVIAAQLAHRPRLILLDEPLVGLDVRSGRVLRDLLLEEAKGGAAILLSSHAISLVEKTCGRILVLRRGKTAFAGGIEEAVARFGGGGDLEEALLRLGQSGEET